MFTGLIESIGEIVRARGDLIAVRSTLAKAVSIGDSIAVDGTCLTVTGVSGDVVSFHVSPESAGRSIVISYRTGTHVNLEPSVRADDRLHGHIVTGHVDCTSKILNIERRGKDRLIRISFPGRYSSLVVEKGSVAVSGISLTVISVLRDQFSIMAIPETLEKTTMVSWKPGTEVNLEFDIIGKYVARHIESMEGSSRLKAFLKENSEY